MSDSRLTSMDASFLYFERKDAPMHIGAVGILDGQVPFEDYKLSIERKLKRLPRFRERAVSVPFFLGHPTWEHDPNFDIDNHVFLHQVEKPGGRAQLQAKADEIIAEMLDRDKALWEIHVLHGLEGGNSALVSKVHHAMVDGVGGNQILLTILDLDPRAGVPDKPEGEIPRGAEGPKRRVADALWDQAKATIESVGDYQKSLLELARTNRRENTQAAITAMRESMPSLALPPKRLPFNKKGGKERHFEWLRFSFAEARSIRSALGGTVNDVVLTVYGGAVRRYCMEHGVPVRGRSMRVMVPVNVRPENAKGDLGNLVSILPVDVPLGHAKAEHRLGAVREITRSLKKARVAQGVSLMSTLMNAVPVPVQAAFGAVAASPFPVFNTVCTNVPGPQIPLYALGCLLKEYYPYVPVGFEMGVGCAIFSYNQTLHIGLNSDVEACPDIASLRGHFEDAIAELKQEAGVADIPVIEIGIRKRPAAPEPAPKRAETKAKVGKKQTASTKKHATKTAGKKKAAKKRTAKKRATPKKTAKKKAKTKARRSAPGRRSKKQAARP